MKAFALRRAGLASVPAYALDDNEPDRRTHTRIAEVAPTARMQTRDRAECQKPNLQTTATTDNVNSALIIQPMA